MVSYPITVAVLCSPSLPRMQKGPLTQWVGAALAELGAAAAGGDGVGGGADASADFVLPIALLRLLRCLAASFPRALSAHDGALLPAVGGQLLLAARAHAARIALEAEEGEAESRA